MSDGKNSIRITYNTARLQRAAISTPGELMHQYKRRLIAAASITALLSASLAAGVAQAQTPAAPAKGKPIPFLQIAAVDSTVFSAPGFPVGAKVAVAAINAAGGINGRPLQGIYCDDKVNPSLAAQCVQQGIDGGMVAKVASVSGTGNVVEPLLQQAQIADFGSLPASTQEFSNPISFPLNTGSYWNSGVGPLARAKYPKAKTYAGVFIVAPGQATRIALLDASMARAGFTKIDQISIPPNSSDLSSIAGQLQRANPDIVVTLQSSVTMNTFLSATKAVGFDKPVFTGTAGITPATLELAGPALPLYNWVDPIPTYNGAVPGAAEFRKQMATYAPGQPLNRDSWAAWISVQAFASIIKSIKGEINSKTVLGTIQNVKCFTVLYFKCLNFTKPGPIADAPAIRVGTVFLLQGKGTSFYPTKYAASIFG